MAEVVLERVHKTYPNGVRAVCDLNLAVADGELIVLVGPSGCGKTTTLRLIAGLETPTSGTIRINGRVVNAEPPHRHNVAMVFQRPALYPHLIVATTSASAWRCGGMSPGRNGPSGWRRNRPAAGVVRPARPTAERAVWRSAAACGPRSRPSGSRRCFCWTNRSATSTRASEWKCGRELHLLHRRLRATMVYVTHDQEEALTLGDRVVLLDGGVVRQVDSPQAGTSDPPTATRPPLSAGRP